MAGILRQAQDERVFRLFIQHPLTLSLSKYARYRLRP